MIDQEQKNDIKQASSFAKYTGIAFQMLATIGILTFIGFKLDAYYAQEQLLFTAIFGVIGVIISLIQIYRSLQKKV